MKAAKCKFKVGQVVSLAPIGGYYNVSRKGEKYQLIVAIEPWPTPCGGYQLTFANGDKCHHKWVKALSAKERG